MARNIEDDTLTRATVRAVVTMGGGCALFLAILGGGAYIATRSSGDSAKSANAASNDDGHAVAQPSNTLAKPLKTEGGSDSTRKASTRI